ncbi:MAG: hypothetical protein ACJAYJ_002868 [Saprospiraceae bacterium]|jgi:hypothetical protein
MPIHGFHLSQTLIEYNETDSTLQISMSLTLDDLEKALEEAGAPRLQLCTGKEHEKGTELMYNYLRANFEIEVNGKPVSYGWIGKELNEDMEGVWIYLEITEVSDLKEIKVKNQVLIEELNDQKNIVQIKGPKAKQGYFMFRKGHLVDRVVF